MHKYVGCGNFMIFETKRGSPVTQKVDLIEETGVHFWMQRQKERSKTNVRSNSTKIVFPGVIDFLKFAITKCSCNLLCNFSFNFKISFPKMLIF